MKPLKFAAALLLASLVLAATAPAQIVSEAKENSAGVLIAKKGRHLGFFFTSGTGAAYSGAPQQKVTTDLLSGLEAYGLVDSGTEGTSQVTTATATGTTSASGTATVVITGAALATDPTTLYVPVSGSAAPAVWGPQIETALVSSTAVSDFYAASGSGATIVLTAITPAANDPTLNISITGTAAGITTETTSAATVAGVAPGTVLPTPLNLNGGPISTGTLTLDSCPIVTSTSQVPLSGTSVGSLSITVSGTTYHIPYK